MNSRFKTLVIILVIALATMAPVCVLAGGDTSTTTSTITLADGALIEVFGEHAELRVFGIGANTLNVTATLNNSEFVDFYTQSLTPEPSSHFVISAKTGGSGSKSANSIIEIGIPEGMQLVVQTTNRDISVEDASLTTVSLTTSNGKISVTNSTGDYDLITTNSEVAVQSVEGQVNIATTNAHVWFDGVVIEGRNTISTNNGDIAVRLRNESDVTVSGATHNGEVTIDGGSNGVSKDGDTATLQHSMNNGTAMFNISNGPGAIHINPKSIAVFDGDS